MERFQRPPGWLVCGSMRRDGGGTGVGGVVYAFEDCGPVQQFVVVDGPEVGECWAGIVFVGLQLVQQPLRYCLGFICHFVSIASLVVQYNDL